MIAHLSLAEAAAAPGPKNAVTAYVRDALAAQGIVGPTATQIEADWAKNAGARMVEASHGALSLRVAKILIDHKPASVQEARAIVQTDATDADIALALVAMCERAPAMG